MAGKKKKTTLKNKIPADLDEANEASGQAIKAKKSSKESKPKNEKVKEAPKKRRSRGTLLSIRSGMQKIAGSDGEEKPATVFDKILDVVFYLALLAFLGWFLYKKVTA